MACVICNCGFETTAPVSVGPIGLSSLRQAAFDRNREDVTNRIKADQKKLDGVRVHATCRKSFTDKRKTQQLKSSAAKENLPVLRSTQPPFAFAGQCFFCAQPLPSAQELRKNPSRHVDVKSIRTEDAEASVRASINGRSADEWAKQVQLRVDSVLSLFAADARYHLQCFRNFTHPRHLASPSPSPSATLCHRGRLPSLPKQSGFEELCKFIESNDECQFSLSRVMEKLTEFTKGEPYSDKQTMRKLGERYGDNIVVSNKPGTMSIICFKGTAAKILSDKWYTERKSDPVAERLRVVKAAAAILRQDIRGAVFNTELYPTAQQIREGGAEQLPETVQVAVRSIIGGKGKPAARKAAYIEQCIVSATRPKSYVSPLKHGLALLLHTRYGSRDLVRLLSGVGAVADYADTLAYETSAAVACSSSTVQAHAFQQYGADNADYNIGTLDGHNTFHVMGMVKMVTPSTAYIHPEAIARGQPAPDSVEHLAKIPIQTYRAPAVPGLLLILVESVDDTGGESAALPFKRLNALWLSAHWAEVDKCPGWNGFMSSAFQLDESYAVSMVIPLPFIHLQPTNPSTIYTTMLHAAQESENLGQDHALLTFDYPLFIKAVDILYAEPRNPKLKNVILRLGGFHLLMSFLGAVGYLMAGSGIEELWQTVYAKNSIKHLMSGHAYSRAVRANLLTYSAMSTLLLIGREIPEETELLSQVEDMVEQILTGVVPHSEAANSDLASKLMEQLDTARAAAESQGRTQRLWVQYLRCVEIVTLFIAAERSGNFTLHLYCVEKMLPFFHASGHLNYARGAHLYLQQMNALEKTMSPLEYHKFTTQGFFTIRRKTKFWSGTWADMIIEQVLMKWFKSVGGLTRGRGVSDKTVARALNSLPETSPIMEAVEDFAGISTGSSEQHVELRDSRRILDSQDLQKFVLWLKMHSPLDKLPEELVSLSSGAVGGSSINCDQAEEIGRKLLLRGVGKDFQTLKLHRKDTCKNLASLVQTTVKVGEDEVEINSNQLFHRSLCVLKTAEEVESAFGYEMAARAPALFESNGRMRKGCKSTLYEILVVEAAEAAAKAAKAAEAAGEAAPAPPTKPQNPKYVIDGGFLLHKVPFPKPASFATIATVFCEYVLEEWGASAEVVFDGGYSSPTPSTKSEERQRRAAKSGCIPIDVQPGTILNIPQEKFLSNGKNKTQFISLLRTRLQECGVNTLQAESDADTLLVQTTLAAARRAGSSAVLVGEDTDLIVLLLHHTNGEDVYMLKPGRGKQSKDETTCVTWMQETLPGVHKYLLFLHAFSGCDTTCAFYRKGKKTAWNTFMKCGNDVLASLTTFYTAGVSAERLGEVGDAFVRRLYGIKEGTPLQKGRFQHYQRTISKQPLTADFDLAVLPPTSPSNLQHCLRVYHQVQEWLGRSLEATECGWKLDGSILRPVTSLEAPAPAHLLRLVYCGCRTTCGARCQCRKAGLPCTAMCRMCAGHSCTNRSEEPEDDTNELDNPDDPAPK